VASIVGTGDVDISFNEPPSIQVWACTKANYSLEIEKATSNISKQDIFLLSVVLLG